MQRQHRQRLQFLVRFAQMDLNALRPGDWLNVRDDLDHYVGALDTFWVTNKDDPHWQTTAASVIQDIQHTTQAILGHIADAQQAERDAMESYAQTSPQDSSHVQIDSTTGHTFSIGAKEAQLLVHYDTRTRKATAVIRYLMDPFGAFLEKLSHDVNDEAVGSLHRCPACATLFVGSGKQRYCSRTCVNRVTSRRWREQGTNREHNNRRARARYQQKVKGHTRVKVGRHGAS